MDAAEEITGEREGIRVRRDGIAGESFLGRQHAAPDDLFERGIAADANMRLWNEGLVERSMRQALRVVFVRPPAILFDLFVTLPHHAEGVVIEAEPDVQAMLQDASVWSPHRGAFSTESPT